WAALALRRRSSGSPSRGVGRPASTSTRAGQSRASPPPAASQPHSAPCSSAGVLASASRSASVATSAHAGNSVPLTCRRVDAGKRVSLAIRREPGLLRPRGAAYTGRMGIHVATPSSLVRGVGVAALPAPAQVAGMPASHLLALLVALLVLAMAGMAIAGSRRRERIHREHLRAIREREQRLRLALWAS